MVCLREVSWTANGWRASSQAGLNASRCFYPRCRSCSEGLTVATVVEMVKNRSMEKMMTKWKMIWSVENEKCGAKSCLALAGKVLWAECGVIQPRCL